MVNIDDFLMYEKQNRLFDNDIDGFKYWSYLRFEIYFLIQNNINNIGVAHTPPKNRSRIKEIPKLIPQYFNVISSIKQKSNQIDYLFLNHQRRVKEGEIYKCLYTDNIISHLGNSSYLIIEEPYEGKHFKPVNNKCLIYVDYLDYHYVIKRKINQIKKMQIIDTKNEKELRFLVDDLSRTFNVKLNANEIISNVRKIKIKHMTFYDHYTRILKNLNPKIVIEVVSYNFSRMVVNEICKELDIPTIELQHGTMGRYHIAYNYAEKMKLSTFPDYVFLFGEFWKDNTRFPIEDNKIKVVGWPYYENKVEIFKKNRTENKKKTILFISQGTIGKELSKVAIKVLDNIDKDSYRIIYKLHPGEYTRWKNEYPWLLDSKLEVIDNNENDMHYYFSQSDIQVGVYSTALFEGLGYGLKTYIVKLYGYQYMEELYNKDLVVLVNDDLKIIEDIEKNHEIKREFVEMYFWLDDSLDRIIHELDNIIEFKDGLDGTKKNT
jgi:hypothetical protein